MKRHFIILLALELFFAYNSYSEDMQGNENDVVFSEMTIDTPPGDDGAWIELYNRGDKPVKLGGYTIVCNNQNVFTFLDNKYFVLNPKNLLLIRFDKNAKEITDGPPEIRAPAHSTIVKTDPLKYNRKGKLYSKSSHIQQRSPGYCALFKNVGISRENLIDYVFWGDEFIEHYKSVLSEEHNQWAKDKKLWDCFGGLNIGMDPPISGECWDRDYLAIQRKLFNRIKEDSWNFWAVETLKDASPGEGNIFLPLSTDFIFGSCLTLGEKLKIDAFGYGYDPRLYEFLKANGSNEKEKIKIRIQIAKDPHFEEIIYNKLIPSEKEIDDYEFVPGTYYARLRIDMDTVCTDWSKAISFTYSEKKSDEDDSEE